MDKDFDTWSGQKKRIHTCGENRLYREREIWWCALGVNIGFEQDGRGADHGRPVLVIKGVSRKTCFVVPLTTSDKVHPLRFDIGVIGDKSAKVILSQLRLVDTKRFVNRVAVLDSKLFDEIKKAIKGML